MVGGPPLGEKRERGRERERRQEIWGGPMTRGDREKERQEAQREDSQEEDFSSKRKRIKTSLSVSSGVWRRKTFLQHSTYDKKERERKREIEREGQRP